MLDYIGWEFWSSAFRPLILGAILAFVVAAFFSFINRSISYKEKLLRNFSALFAISMPIALLGYVAGYLTGLSRSPTVGTIVPAVLTLIGGFGVYLFDTEPKKRILIGYTIFLFALVLFYGANVGALNREAGLEERLKDLSQQEFRVRNFRKNLGLPSGLPEWIFEHASKEDHE